LVGGLKKLGWDVEMPKASFYVWIRIPEGMKSMDMTRLLIQETAVVTTPGNGFGQYGEGYIRMTVTSPKERLTEAVERIGKVQI
ncbi:MAG: aminotransferase class I/II-fold pyridoxal phosphate-dependent enzyme, partial [Candidatus Latescibacterota bacterium]